MKESKSLFNSREKLVAYVKHSENDYLIFVLPEQKIEGLKNIVASQQKGYTVYKITADEFSEVKKRNKLYWQEELKQPDLFDWIV